MTLVDVEPTAYEFRARPSQVFDMLGQCHLSARKISGSTWWQTRCPRCVSGKLRFGFTAPGRCLVECLDGCDGQQVAVWLVLGIRPW